MPRVFIVAAVAAVLLGQLNRGVIAWCNPQPEAGGAEQPMEDSLKDAVRLRGVVQAMHLYTHMNDGRLPSGLGELLPFLSDGDGKSGVERFLFSERARKPQIPAKPDGAWMEEHSSFRYIGAGGISIDSVPDWSSIAIGHLDFSLAYPTPATPEAPADASVVVGFVDGHIEFLPEAEARWIVADSEATFKALKENTPLPDHRQLMVDVTLIARAIIAYAERHDGLAPPTLGAALDSIPADAKKPLTPAEKAALFLSPTARRNTHVPQDAAAEWVDANTSYIYLAGDGVLHKAIEDPSRIIILHLKPELAIERSSPREPLRKGVVYLTAGLHAQLAEAEFVAEMARESREVIRAVSTGTPLPPYQDAMRDLRFLATACRLYADANGGALPPSLGATLPFLEQAGLGKADEAAKARTYLLRGDERPESFPEVVTAEWIDRASSYVYTGPGGVNAQVKPKNDGQSDAWRYVPLLHAPVAKPFSLIAPGGRIEAIPYAMFGMPAVQFLTPDFADQSLKEAKEQFSQSRK